MGIFHGSHTCPAPKNAAEINTVAQPIVGSVTFQHLILYICAGCTGVASILCLVNIFIHLAHYSRPKEQRQIVRVVFTPVIFCLFSIFTQIGYSSAIYMPPIRDLYESFALAAIFLLFVEYVAPDPSTRSAYFSNLENRQPRGGRFSNSNKDYDIVPGGSLRFFKTRWIILFLFLVVEIIITITQEASQATGTYCLTSMKPYFAHVWVLVIGHGATAVAVIAILRFYGRLKAVPEFASHRPLLKLISLKLIVFTNFIQTFVFSILQGQGVLTGNHKVTANDLQYGIPSLLTAVENVIFAAFMLYSFRASEYKGDGKAMSFPAAAAHALNPLDYIQGIFTAFRYLLGVAATHQGGHNHNNVLRNGLQQAYSSGEDTVMNPNMQNYNVKYGSQGDAEAMRY
jgi:Organic solute transporter Ostalpha